MVSPFSPRRAEGPVPLILHEFALHQVGSLLISSSACWDLRRGRASAHATAQYKASSCLSSCRVSHSLVRREEKALGRPHCGLPVLEGSI